MKTTTPCVYKQMGSKDFLFILSKLTSRELAVSFGIKLVWENVPIEASGGEHLYGELVGGAVTAPPRVVPVLTYFSIFYYNDASKPGVRWGHCLIIP